MDHQLGGFGPAGALGHVLKSFSQPFLDSTGRLNLATIGFLSMTPRAVFHIFANYRQLRHMSSPAYRAPEHWGKQSVISSEGSGTSCTKAFNQVKHRLRIDLLTWGSSVLVNAGMLFGGYDRLWRVCEGVAISATAGTESLTERVVSTTLFTLGTMAIDLTVGLVWGPVYRYFTSTATPSPCESYKDGLVFTFSNIWYMSDKEKRDAVLRSPAWKQWSMAGCTLGLVTLLPTIALTALYERMGPKSVAPMAKTIAVGAAAFLGLANGPYLWASWSGKLDSTLETDRKTGTKWPTLAQWSQDRKLNIDPEELENKIKTMLPEVSLVELLVRNSVDETDCEGPERLAASLLIPAVRLTENRCIICLRDTQVGSLDLQEQMAVVAEAIVKGDKELRSYHIMQLGSLLKVLPYPFLHDYYTRQPSVLGSIFPNLTTNRIAHIPLAISWTITSCLTGILDCLNDIVQATELRLALWDDHRIASFSPECAEGLPKVLRKREQARLEQEGPHALDLDIGTLDTIYAATEGNSTQNLTHRIASLECISRTSS